jgi:hypothetical protein
MTYLDVANQLAATPANLRHLLNLVPDELAQWRPQEQAWCINEIIGHLTWADQFAFTDRLRIMTEQSQDTLPLITLPLINVNQAAIDRQDQLKTLASLLAEFESARAKHVPYIRTLEPSTLSHSARYKDKTWLASDFLYEWPFHDYGHIAQIMRNLRANLAPYMSETMRTAVGY